MTRTEVIARLKTVEPVLRQCGVAALYLFGSHARDEARAGSTWTSSSIRPTRTPCDSRPSWRLVTVLQQTFPGIELGYSTRDSIVPCYRPYIEDGAIRVF